MTNEKTTRELVYETNRDVKWICKMLQRMEAQDEEFEARIRALEGWRAEKAGEDLHQKVMVGDAPLGKRHPGMVQEVLDVLPPPGREVVDNDDVVVLC